MKIRRKVKKDAFYPQKFAEKQKKEWLALNGL